MSASVRRNGWERKIMGSVLSSLSSLCFYKLFMALSIYLCNNLQNEDLLFVVQFVKNHRQQHRYICIILYPLRIWIRFTFTLFPVIGLSRYPSARIINSGNYKEEATHRPKYINHQFFSSCEVNSCSLIFLEKGKQCQNVCKSLRNNRFSHMEQIKSITQIQFTKSEFNQGPSIYYVIQIWGPVRPSPPIVIL